MCNILITAPSLDENINISGISSLTRTIITRNSVNHRYFHFQIGKKDADGKRLKWLINQLMLLPRFIIFILEKKIELIHFNTALNPASIIRDHILVIIAGSILRKQIVLHIHGGSLLMSPPKKYSVFYFMVTGMLRNAKLKIVLSEIEKKEINTLYRTICEVMPNAVEVNTDVIQKNFNGKLSLLFMGRIVKSKGIFLITKCLSEMTPYFKDFEFQIYGTGPDLQEFLHELSEIKELNYKYCGVVGGLKKNQVFEHSHVFLLPSIYGEGLPIAMLESMNYGCVPVVSDDASIGTVITDGSNGYLVKKGSTVQLKDKLTNVFDNRSKLFELSNDSKQTINTSYNLENYITALNGLYSSVRQVS